MSTIETVVTIFKSLQPLPLACQKELEKAVTLKKLKKKGLLPAGNNKTPCGYLVLKGCLRYYYGAKDKPITSQFLMPNCYLPPLNNTDGTDTLEALSDCVVAVFLNEAMAPLFKRYGDLHFIFEQLQQNHQQQLENTTRMLRLKTPGERLLRFSQLYARLSYAVNDEQVASFLNMSRETLVRLKKLRR
jgi:CRP-like cAMP-binding protein